MKKMPDEYYQLVHQLQMVDFVLVELNLYLDTHPADTGAIEQYNLYAQKKQALKQAFDQRFGPLQGFGNSMSPAPFAWKEAPWPWQV